MSVLTHVSSSHVNLFFTRGNVHIGKEFNSHRIEYTNMAVVSLFWNTNMAAVTSCEKGNRFTFDFFLFVQP